MRMSCAAGATVLAVGLSYVGVAWLFCMHAPLAYMDEVFHFPQTQRYCEGRWDVWDPKITTFPGLYIVGTWLGTAVHFTQSFVQHDSPLCSLTVLRSANVLFSLGSLFLIVKLRSMKYSASTATTGIVHGVAIALFPVHYFFSFLYYTDAGALFFVLVMYYFAQVGRTDRLRRGAWTTSNLISVASGFAAVGFRQTNVIWVVFVVGSEIVSDLEAAHATALYGPGDGAAASTAVGLDSTLLAFVVVLLKNSRRLFTLFWPHLSILVAFGIFLVYNGSITVGDKANHVATFHFGQILYFSVVCASGLGLACLDPQNVGRFFKTLGHRQSVGWAFLVGAIFLGLIFCFSDVHPFMLADNRHFTFYIWKRFFLKHPLMKLVPAPLYAYCLWLLWQNLRAATSPLRATVFFVATALVLIPTPLVEPRYYIVPFVLYHVNAKNQPLHHLVWISVSYGVVNAWTISIYLFKPFTWPDGTEARFMW
ncbi:hypothetical protein H310_08574 [Aphanomyces invadans]|uniref:Dol-P-Glc:Glc(2)Man(9)GlcNAc(2)-PP-Dol alpha-1,2-glucosyltransferase n=1 Tax=Aphanomyces invadans TaxID=157072 RepID=A0A024TYM3_9STRA|nr:hypothetical protein H310_08574 [Aphanomyces invadans]ETV98407.1 hypothetical protein H310_08574 [Aphanomyces invadans]|eukprot:XP_008872604.1 hypothetical protein H310_08574 [Aphanomyces invadans]